jgi:hypothetical protein
MLNANEAVARLMAYRNSLGIPSQAALSLLEKRSIELADRDEIEPVLPVPVAGASAGNGDEEEGEGAEEAEGPASGSATNPAATPAPAAGVDAAKEPSPPAYTETLAWVGRFTYQIFFWELALDEDGDLIRLRKSR